MVVCSTQFQVLAVAAVLTGGLADAAHGQEADRGVVDCPPCEVSAWKVGLLTGGRAGLEDHYVSAAVGVDGRLFFATTNANRPVFVGDLVTDRVAPMAPVGSGPGEVRYAARIRRAKGDSLLVHDRSLNRMNVLSPDGRFARSISFMPGTDDFVPLPDGSFFVAARIGSRESSGHPFHLVGADGRWQKSFGGSDREVRPITPQDQYRLFRWVAPASDGSILAVRPGGYVLERWSPDGKLIMERDVAPDWFTPKYEQRSERPLEQAPPPYITSIQEGADGRIWVLVMRADEQWRSGIRPVTSSPAGYEVISHTKFVDTQIEVFDPRTFARVASYRLDQPLGIFVAPGVAASARAVLNDEPIIELWRMRILPP